jgi:hypothetical protein
VYDCFGRLTGVVTDFERSRASSRNTPTRNSLPQGGWNFKRLPSGWKFRVKTLKKDLIEVPEGGVATIMPDEFFNIYDETGPGMTNFKP